MWWVEAIGYLGTAFTIGTYAMGKMIPLRIMSLISSAAFVAYGLLTQTYPVVITELILLPLNAYRLYEMLRLINQVDLASKSDLSMDWLKPFATRRKVAAGEILFDKGDKATEMFCINSGRFRLKETAIELDAGEIVGELGLLSPDNRRTQTLECTEDGDLLRISYFDLKQLYFQNPQFGFFFLRLVSERLFRNLETAHAAPEYVSQPI